MTSSAINYTGSAGGRVVQVQKYETGAVATGTTVMVQDDNIPQNTDGDEYMSFSITPTNASNILKIDVVLNCAHSVGGQHMMSLFQDTTADALATVANLQSGNDFNQLKLTHYMTAGTTDSTTFKVRSGSVSGGTMTFNGKTGTRYFGGTSASSLTITEIAPGQASVSGSGALTGEIKMWGTDTAPEGYLLADGSDVSQTTYADLYAVIGTTFGAPGGGNFTLPDFRGRVPLGKDNMGGVSADRVTASEADTLGDGSGAETHTLTEAELASHDHTGVLLADTPDIAVWTAVGGAPNGSSAGNNSTANAGSGNSHNNVQPYQTINYIIKT